MSGVLLAVVDQQLDLVQGEIILWYEFDKLECDFVSVTPDKLLHEKPPAVKPTLQDLDLAIIPLQEPPWYMLGQAQGSKKA